MLFESFMYPGKFMHFLLCVKYFILSHGDVHQFYCTYEASRNFLCSYVINQYESEAKLILVPKYSYVLTSERCGAVYRNNTVMNYLLWFEF